jgi:hypothetical protein
MGMGNSRAGGQAMSEELGLGERAGRGEKEGAATGQHVEYMPPPFYRAESWAAHRRAAEWLERGFRTASPKPKNALWVVGADSQSVVSVSQCAAAEGEKVSAVS